MVPLLIIVYCLSAVCDVAVRLGEDLLKYTVWYS
jgi:hypothetical protein